MLKLPPCEFHKTSVMISADSGNGLVPEGNKSLPEPMLTKFYDATWRH